MAGQINLEISNFEEQNFCRLCMSSVFGLRPLIPKEPTETDMMAKIRSLTEVTIIPSEERNARICSRCVQQLEDFDLFRRRCKDSDLQIRRIRAGRKQLQRSDNTSPGEVPAKQSMVGSQDPVESGSVTPITGERFGGMINLLEYCEDGILPGEYRMLYSGYVYRRKSLMVWQCEQTTCPCLLQVMKQDFSNFSVNGTHNHGQVPPSNEKRKFTKMNNRVCSFLNDLRKPKHPPAVPQLVTGEQSAIDRPHVSSAIVPQLSHVSPRPIPISLALSKAQRHQIIQNTTPQQRAFGRVREVSIHPDIPGRYPMVTPRPSLSRGLNQHRAAQYTQGTVKRTPLYKPSAGILARNAETQASQSVRFSAQSSTTLDQMESSRPSTVAAEKSASTALPGTSNVIQTTQKEKVTGSAKRKEYVPPVPPEISDTIPKRSRCLNWMKTDPPAESSLVAEKSKEPIAPSSVFAAKPPEPSTTSAAQQRYSETGKQKPPAIEISNTDVTVPPTTLGQVLKKL